MATIISTLKGALGAAVLFGVYFSLVTLISGWNFALSQFFSYWYYIVGLAFGFGVQIGLYSYLRCLVLGNNISRKPLAVSGATSTVAMVSCCAHYLVNILPIIGIAGFLSVVGQYQIELFWLGLVSNAAGIVYIGGKLKKFINEKRN